MLKLIIVLVVILVLGGGIYWFFNSRPSLNIPIISDKKVAKENIFYEAIPGSKFHSPDATWWGYNQSKIARFDNLVFMYVIENIDDSNEQSSSASKTLSNLVVYLKDGEKDWQKGASFPTSRPGNILVDSLGVLHAFIFEPTDVNKNDSIGKLMHYWFPNANSGDILNFQQEIIVEAQEGVETVNIRVGAAISSEDTMALGFGLTTYNPLYTGHSEHLYFKKPQEEKWTHLIAGENLGHDFYYPFVLATNDGFHLLSVQDDFTEVGNPNIYQKIIYFEYKGGQWKQEIIADLTKHELASTRPRLLEQSDLYKDSSEKMHILYKEFLDPQSQWKTTRIWHLIKTEQGWDKKELDVETNNIGWIRLIEVEGVLYYLGTSWNEVYLMKVGSNSWVQLDIPKDVKAIYPYVSTKKGGTRDVEKYVDVLLLGADQQEYFTTTHYYLRIPKLKLNGY